MENQAPVDKLCLNYNTIVKYLPGIDKFDDHFDMLKRKFTVHSLKQHI